MRGGFAAGGIGLFAIVCCAGLPLLAAAGLSAASFALTGGIAVGAVALALGIVAVVVRVRSARRGACSIPARSTGEV